MIGGATYNPFGPVTGWTQGGRPDTITYPSGRAITRSYDDDGRVTKLAESTATVKGKRARPCGTVCYAQAHGARPSANCGPVSALPVTPPRATLIPAF